MRYDLPFFVRVFWNCITFFHVCDWPTHSHGNTRCRRRYVPNSGQKLDRLDARTHVWDPALRSTCISLAAKQPLLLVGDLNVAFHDCDIHDPKTNRNKSAGFCDGERDGFAALLAAGMHDTWRERNPDVQQFT